MVSSESSDNTEEESFDFIDDAEVLGDMFAGFYPAEKPLTLKQAFEEMGNRIRNARFALRGGNRREDR